MEHSKTALILLVILATLFTAESLNLVGLNYGTQGNNLPPPREVIDLYKHLNVGKVRLFEPLPEVLEALRGSGIEVSVGIRNEDLPGLASNKAAVSAWIAAHVEPYLNNVVFKYITVGNEVIPGNLGKFVTPVLESFQAELTAKGRAGIKVTTVVPASVLSVSYPPSAGQFSAESVEDLRAVIRFLSSTQSPLMINVYPYFAYASNTAEIRLDYAQFTASGAVVQDGALGYRTLFEAQVDAFVSAIEKVGGGGVGVVVSESGWPSAGNGDLTTPALAAAYSKGFIAHIESRAGTPKRPGASIEGYIFATFNENLKTPGVEQNFGLFNPDKTPVYPLF